MAGYRAVLYGCYASYAMAGVAFQIRPPPTLNNALESGWYAIWAALFSVGGIIGLVGAVSKHRGSHYVEGIGLMSIGGAMLVYMLALLLAEPLRESSGVNIGLTLFICGSLAALISRAIVLRNQIQIRERESKGVQHGESN